MLNPQLDEIQYADIEQLVEHAEAERRILEYKQALAVGTDAEKREFLADVSSFANASGGDLLFGVAERRDAAGSGTGVPERIAGLSINSDAEIRRLESLIREGIKPRLRAYVKPLSGAQGTVLLIRVPKSLAAPHAVVLGGSGASLRFYTRNSAGKYPLDVHELRLAFVASSDLEERVKRFRAERLARIVAGETPVPLWDAPRLVLHLVPLQSGLGADTGDATAAAREVQRELEPMPDSVSASRYNLDGFLTSWFPRALHSHVAYTQLFRNGAVEAVDAYTLSEPPNPPFIPSLKCENLIIASTERYLAALARLGVTTPILIMLSALGVRGFRVKPYESFWRDDKGGEIDRDSVVLPEVAVEEFERLAVQHVLRPVFDALWQSAGWDCCGNYDQSGNHVGATANG